MVRCSFMVRVCMFGKWLGVFSKWLWMCLVRLLCIWW